MATRVHGIVKKDGRGVNGRLVELIRRAARTIFPGKEVEAEQKKDAFLAWPAPSARSNWKTERMSNWSQP